MFNICSNKANSFDRDTLEYFHEVSQAAYSQAAYHTSYFQSSPNPAYWKELHSKFLAISLEIQDASKSLNKSFGEHLQFEVIWIWMLVSQHFLS